MKKYAATETTTVKRPSFENALAIVSIVETEKSHDDKDPPPSTQTGDSFHFGDSKCLKPHERHVGGREHKRLLTNIPPSPPARVAVERSRAIR